jgi:hypothetical protein
VGGFWTSPTCKVPLGPLAQNVIEFLVPEITTVSLVSCKAAMVRWNSNASIWTMKEYFGGGGGIWIGSMRGTVSIS